ncbi:MAG: hypothetical protein B7Z23_08025, partial [Pseudomonadales bacterium 32-61-5]
GRPGAMLSAGNLNTAALTLFIALHLSVKPPFPWLVLDDPVQSMDELHIAQFAALLRTLAKVQGRQVIVAVHERPLFEYLALELSPAFPEDKLITVELAPQAGREHLQLLTIALQRAIHSLCAILARATQLYSPPPEGLWLELHQLYAIAVEHNVQRTLVRDDIAYRSVGLSAERSYIVALMLGSARCNQLRQQSIAQLAQALEPWSDLVRLQAAQHASSLLVLSPRVDGPPRYRSMLRVEELPQQLGIDPQALVDAIQAHLQGLPGTSGIELEIPQGLSPDLLHHLSSAWGDASERSFQRISAQGSLQLCIGMSALHYHLAGQRPFGDLLQRPEAARSATFKLNNAAPDVWAVAFDAQPVNDAGLLSSDSIEFVRPAKPTQEEASGSMVESAFPTHTVQMVNHSPGGYCLSWAGETPAQLQAGELLGLRNNAEESWSVAVVRWVRQVVDLAGQLATAVGPGDLRRTCHAVADSMRRGVVATDLTED